MHPAFSVIFFTVLSGLGYGLWIWTAFWAPLERDAGINHYVVLLVAVVPVVIGLASSVGHLGKPLRAWRSFSQWRTSWLSREGLLAVATFVPWALLAAMSLPPRLVPGLNPPQWSDPVLFLLLACLALLSLATVFCTAMIYASLKPIAAWRHRAVFPAYLGFALLTGGLASTAFVAPRTAGTIEAKALVLLLLAVALVVLKRRYWRDIDRGAMPATRASALGLPADRVATVFERPHTEANYLTREMGYVLARKHSVKLRRLALVLFGAVPAVGCAITLLQPGFAPVVLGVAALSALLGAMVERWLFFAEAKHAVMLYY